VPDLRPYLIQVVHGLEDVVEGTGFICHPEGFALTCWHVVKEWPQREGRGEVIWREERVAAELLIDRSVEASDLAVLKLSRPNAAQGKEEWPFLPLDVYWRLRMHDELHSFGYPEGKFDKSGIQASGQIIGQEQIPVDGVEVLPITGNILDNIRAGYSGAPVINERTQKVIGLVRAKQHERQAFIVPLTPLFGAWPELRALHDIFEQIRQKIGEQAQAALNQKLHNSPFIPLNLQVGHLSEESKDATTTSAEGEAYAHHRFWKSFDVKDLLPPDGRYVLSADVGTGKTAFVNWLAAELVRRTRFLPVVMSCRELEQHAPKRCDDVLEAVAEPLKSAFLPVDLEECFAETKREKGLVFLFDGLDQIRGRMPSDIIELALSLADGSSVLIASRPSAVIAVEDDHSLTFLRLQPFTQENQRRYFGLQYATARTVCALAPELTEVPMLAFMVRELIKKGTSKKAVTRTELYGQFVHHVLTEHEPNKPLKDIPGLVTKFERVLSKFAFDALAQAEPHMQRVPIELYADEASVPLSELIAFGLVDRIFDIGEEALFFTHQSFQEFLAAKHAARTPETIEVVLNERWHPKWAEVIPFIVGLQDEPILENIITGDDNVIYSSLFLASRCANELIEISAPRVAYLRRRLLKLTNTYEFYPLLQRPFSCYPLRIRAFQALCGVWHRFNPSDQKWILSSLQSWRPSPSWLSSPDLSDYERLKWGEEEDERDFVGDEGAQEVLEAWGSRNPDKALSALVGWLDDSNTHVRYVALRSIQSFSYRIGSELFSAICKRLTDNDTDVRTAAADALACACDQIDANSLLDLLSDADSLVRNAAAGALCKCLDLDLSSLNTILGKIRGSNFEVSCAAAWVLSHLQQPLDTKIVAELVDWLQQVSREQHTPLEIVIGPFAQVNADTLRAITQWLDNEDATVRYAAVEAIKSASDRVDTDSLRKLISLVHCENSHVREAAIRALGLLDYRSDLCRDLIRCLRDENAEVRLAALTSLKSATGHLDTAMLGEVVGCLHDEKVPICIAALVVLKLEGARLDTKMLHELVGCLHAESADVRQGALSAIESADGRVDTGIQREIVACLKDEDVGVRRYAMSAINSLSTPYDTESLQVLLGLVQEKEFFADVVAAVRSRKIQLDPETIRVILGRVLDGDSHVRTDALYALASLTDQVNREALDAILGRMHDDEESDVRRAAAWALGALSDWLDPDTVHQLVNWVRDENGWLREAAVGVLGCLSDRLEVEVLPDLVSCLQDEVANVRKAAVEALQAQRTRLNADMRYQLFDRLIDEAWEVREAASRAVRALAIRPDVEAVRALVDLLKVDNWESREIALKALQLCSDQLDADATRTVAELLYDRDTNRVQDAAYNLLEGCLAAGQELPSEALGAQCLEDLAGGADELRAIHAEVMGNVR
jgi:HEAT repeat protein